MIIAVTLLLFAYVAIESGMRGQSIPEFLRGDAAPEPQGILQSANFPGSVAPDAKPVTPLPVGFQPTGVGKFDGKNVANWIIPYLSAARKSGDWKGSVNSGYRSPAEQRATCIAKCGAPSCGGSCAAPGGSRHQGTKYPNGAVDVSDAPGLERYMRKTNGPLYYAPSDPCQCHFSTGDKAGLTGY